MKFHFKLLLLSFFALSFYFTSCDNAVNIIEDIVSNNVTAKDRLDSAIAQSKRLDPNSDLILIFGKNVDSIGRTDITGITAISDPNSLGAWLYVFKSPTDTTVRVFTPNPLPGARDCINLTQFFDLRTILNLIPDTSASNIVKGAIDILLDVNSIKISTPVSLLVDSDVALSNSNTTSPVITFNASFVPSTSNVNGNVFLSGGTNKSRNMFLIPAAGTLGLSSFITDLIGFPPDVWVTNYKKNSGSSDDNLIIATVPQASQLMGIPGLVQSKAINLSKFIAVQNVLG